MLASIAVLMVHMEGQVAHQMVMGHLQDAVDVFDPNGGYSSFANPREAADWFVRDLIGNTVYDTARLGLVQYLK